MLTQRLRHRITLQRQVQTQDLDAGGAVELTWEDFAADEPAEVVPVSGREFIQANAMQIQVSARMTIRYRAEVDPAMRVVFDGETYDIQAVLPDSSARRWLTLMVTKGTGDGD